MFLEATTCTVIGGSMETATNAIWLTRWLLTIPLALLFVWAATFNAWVWWRLFIKREKNAPTVGPFIGGVSGGLAMLLCPILGTSEFAWIPLVLDVGCLPYFPVYFPLLALYGLRERHS